MIFNVKKRNFTIYLSCFIFGIALDLFSIFFSSLPEVLSNLFLSLGCSTIPSAIVAFLVDRANELQNIENKKRLREEFMDKFPHGIEWISRAIIESYYPLTSNDSNSIKSCFDTSIDVMKNVQLDDASFSEYERHKEKLIRTLDYGILLCLDSCKPIMNHKYELQINSIFTKKEILLIKNIVYTCEEIKHSYAICELAEHLDLLIENVYNSLKEIQLILDKKIVIQNHRVKYTN